MIEAFEKLSLTSSQYYGEISSGQFSQHLIDTPPIRKIDSLMVSNFKSFKGKVYVGPLLDFTSIVGPNGSGKSNILDALMFCLCNQRSKIAFYDIRQFIHRDGDQTYSEMSQKGKFCQVEAHFIVGSGKRLTFKRTLHPNEKQEFSIDGEEYSQRVYENYLMRCNLNYITSNYAIWQGQVDKLLLKSPIELTALLETISGSAFFKNDHQKLKQELLKVEETVEIETAKLVKLRLELKNLKKIHNTKGNAEKAQAEYETCGKKMLMLKMLLSQMEIKAMEKELSAANQQQKQKIKKLNQSKIRVQKEQAQRIDIQNKLNIVMKEVAQSNTLLKSIQQSANILQVQSFKQLENQVHSLKKYADSLTNRKAEAQRQAFNLQSLDVDKEYLALFSKWEKENQVMTKELAKKKTEYVYSEGILRTKRSILSEFQQKMQRAEKQEQDLEVKRREIQANIEQLGKNIGRMKVEQGKLSQEYLNNKGRLEDRYQKLNELDDKIVQLEGFLTENIQNEKDKELVKVLSSINGYKGFVEESVKPVSKKYEICFQIMMGSLLKHILSADEQASKSIGAKLRQHGKIKTLIILSNVKEKKDQLNRSALGRQAQPAFEAVQFDKNLTNLNIFLQEYLNGKVICDNMEAAWALLGQNVRGVREIYTLDGNVLRHDGIVSTYGSTDSFTKKYKYVNGAKNRTLVMEDIQSLHKQKAAIEEDVKSLKEKASDEKIARHNLQISRLEARRQELATSLALLKKGGNGKQQVKVPAGLQREIQELERKVSGIRESMKEIEKQVLGSKIFTDFLRKNNISSLDSFRSLEDLSSLQAKMKQKSKVAKQIEELDRQAAKMTANIAGKQERLHKMESRVNTAVNQQRKADILSKLKSGEQQMALLRSQLNKLDSINVEALKFKSQIPLLQSKLSLLKERYKNMVKSELAHLGLENPPQENQFKKLDDHLPVTAFRATRQHLTEALQELTKQLQILQSLLERQLLDMSAFQETGNYKERVQKQVEEINTILKDCNDKKADISQKLEVVKRDRKSLFMNFFNVLSPILRKTYQMLTTEGKNTIPGKVDLFLQNEEFPCDDGVYFYPTPPNKRFVYDLDQLSGGEKSIASLALQYSIAIASKSPFLMLDEIDAFLDHNNVSKFTQLVNESVRDKSLQFILVTHKRSLFLSSKSLVGVTKSKKNPFSQAYSLLLADENDLEEEQ